MTVRIIVNADDLGINDAVNEAIFKAMERGAVTSATLLANGPAITASVRMLPRFPKCSFGVHLNLTQFSPMNSDSYTSLSSILDDQNCFNGNAIREVNIGLPTLRGIYREWCSQIESLTRSGVEVTHMDSHHHVHTIPQLLPVLAALRRRYKINRIRISRNLYSEARPASKALLAKKALYNQALKIFGFKTTGIFTDLETFVAMCSCRPAQRGSIEVMTHPGSEPPGEETRLLSGNWPAMLRYDAALVSYGAL